MRLASIHNLRFYLRLLEGARAAIAAGRFASFAADTRRHFDGEA
jgi:tRNA-guanine family transglycosylase